MAMMHRACSWCKRRPARVVCYAFQLFALCQCQWSLQGTHAHGTLTMHVHPPGHSVLARATQPTMRAAHSFCLLHAHAAVTLLVATVRQPWPAGLAFVFVRKKLALFERYPIWGSVPFQAG